VYALSAFNFLKIEEIGKFECDAIKNLQNKGKAGQQ
jgi:hypothetical protein